MIPLAEPGPKLTPSPPNRDDRSPMAIAVQWASRVTSIGLTFALPPLAGAYLDRLWTPKPWGTLVGVVVGFAVGMGQVLKIAREGPKSGAPRGAGPSRTT